MAPKGTKTADDGQFKPCEEETRVSLARSYSFS